MLGWHLDKNNAYPDRIGDPHLDQPPRFALRCPQDRHAGTGEPPMFGVDIAHLQPQRQRVRVPSDAATGHLQETATEEEDECRVSRIAELPVYGETQNVAVELPAARQIGRAQQDPTT